GGRGGTLAASRSLEHAMHAQTLEAPQRQFGMIDIGHIDELARRLSSLVPPGLREGREELQQNFKSVLQAGLGRLDLVTRAECGARLPGAAERANTPEAPPQD